MAKRRPGSVGFAMCWVARQIIDPWVQRYGSEPGSQCFLLVRSLVHRYNGHWHIMTKWPICGPLLYRRQPPVQPCVTPTQPVMFYNHTRHSTRSTTTAVHDGTSCRGQRAFFLLLNVAAWVGLR